MSERMFAPQVMIEKFNKPENERHGIHESIRVLADKLGDLHAQNEAVWKELGEYLKIDVVNGQFRVNRETAEVIANE